MSVRTDFGARLKQAREAGGLSLRDIAATTKISVSALEGLEHGDASRLPGGIFSRAFVRAYATECGLDPEATVREFLELFPDDTNPVRNPVMIAEVGEPPARRWGRVALATIVLTAAAVTAFLLMGWVPAAWLALRPAEPQQAEVAPVMPPPPAAPALPVADPPAPSQGDDASVPEPVATTEGGPAPQTAVHDVAQVSQSESLQLVVHATARCWVHIVADGAVVFAREMAAGERGAHEARASFVITVGNAGAFAYTINGVPGRPLGADGKVVKVRIDRESLPEFLAE